jgi:hypothetical protein
MKRTRAMVNSSVVSHKCDMGKNHTNALILAGHFDFDGNPTSRKMKKLAGQ